MKAGNAKRILIAVALGGIPLITTVSCDPYTAAVRVFRDDDYGDCGLFDFVCDALDIVDDCLFHNCHDDRHDGFILFD